MKKIAILGLGAFGQSLSRSLTELGAEVIAIDRDISRVEEIQDYVSVAVRLDSTDQNALMAQGIHEVDIAIVCIGEDFESNLLTAVLMKQMGVPKVITRATRTIEEKILNAVGIDQVVLPEQEIGEKLAYSLMHPQLHEIFYVADQFSIAEFKAPEKMLGKPLSELHLRRKHGINLLIIRRKVVTTGKDGQTFEKVESVLPEAESKLQAGDMLLVLGKKKEIKKFLA